MQIFAVQAKMVLGDQQPLSHLCDSVRQRSQMTVHSLHCMLQIQDPGVRASLLEHVSYLAAEVGKVLYRAAGHNLRSQEPYKRWDASVEAARQCIEVSLASTPIEWNRIAQLQRNVSGERRRVRA
jgi:hypothetical protein